MTYCCDHIKKAYELISNSRSRLDWRPADLDFGDFVAGIFTLNASTCNKAGNYVDEALRRMVDARNTLSAAQREINACSCENYDNLLDKFNDLRSDHEGLNRRNESIRNDRERERIDNARTITSLQRQLESSSEKIAEFSWELSQVQQQYQAHQEVPAN